MAAGHVLDLTALVHAGALFVPPDDRYRIEAFVPSAGHENHAANLVELPNGDILCVWFAGSQEGKSDVSIYMSRLSSNAAQWSAPIKLSDDSLRSEQNPCLFLAPDDKLWLYYTAQETRSESRAEWERRVAEGDAQGPFCMQWTATIRCRISSDWGVTWGPVQTLMSRPGSFCRQPMIVMSNGEWLFPMYYSILDNALYGRDYTVMQISSDQGQHWIEYSVPSSRGRVHASVVELSPGRLVAFFRSRAADHIYSSHSTDYGRTWSPPECTSLPNNNSSIQAIRLKSGLLALVFNHVHAGNDPDATLWPWQRYPVSIALSEDQGETWPYIRHLDTGDNFCGSRNEHLNRTCAYPCILQTRDELIHVAYSYRDRQCIKYMRFSEDWIKEQRHTL